MSVAGIGNYYYWCVLRLLVYKKKLFPKGPIVYPPMVTYLLMTYGVNGTVLILGGISIHTVMAALMLQPIKWHMKCVIVHSEEQVLMQADDSDEHSDDVFVKPGFYIGLQRTNACEYFNMEDDEHLSKIIP